MKDRLDHEASYVDSQETKIVDLKSQLADIHLELHSEKQEVINREHKSERILEKLIDRERNDKESEKKLREKEKKIDYLESETES